MFNRIPIPRLPNRHTDRKSGRVARACDECRARKSKCDGDRPICGQCSRADLRTCVYKESKRTQERKELEWATRKIDRYERLFREISQEVEITVAEKIMKALVCFQAISQALFTLTGRLAAFAPRASTASRDKQILQYLNVFRWLSGRSGYSRRGRQSEQS